MSEGLVEWLRAQLGEDQRGVRDYDFMSLTNMHETEARLLREIEAKRRRLDRHRPIEADDTDWVACSYCRVTWPCADLRDDLAVYVDRPGYQESWRPT